jgi:hypothetical protein
VPGCGGVSNTENIPELDEQALAGTPSFYVILRDPVVEHVTVFVDSSPQGPLAGIDRQKQLVEMLGVAELIVPVTLISLTLT